MQLLEKQSTGGNKVKPRYIDADEARLLAQAKSRAATYRLLTYPAREQQRKDRLASVRRGRARLGL